MGKKVFKKGHGYDVTKLRVDGRKKGAKQDNFIFAVSGSILNFIMFFLITIPGKAFHLIWRISWNSVTILMKLMFVFSLETVKFFTGLFSKSIKKFGDSKKLKDKN